jgi:hypothetical protein
VLLGEKGLTLAVPYWGVIENVVELCPQFEEASFTHINPLQKVHIPIVLTTRPQGIASKTTSPSGARQQSNVARVVDEF